MRTLALSLLRISLGVVVALSGVVAGLVWVVRQPAFGSRAFPGELHADPSLLEAHVRFLADPKNPRSWRNPTGLDRAASYVAGSLRRTGARCSEQPYRAGTLETKNVIARFGPDDGPRIVVGAHYDVCGELPGADDNASGVAGLLELARLLSRQTLASPVELVAYSTEEPPFFGGSEMGSAVHAAGLARSGARVRVMIGLEMIGYFQPEQPNENALLHLIYPHHGTFISISGRWADRGFVKEAKRCFRGATSVEAVSYSGPPAVGTDLSDHRNYWAAGYPAVMVCDTAFLRNPNYHGPTDTADSLDYRRMAGVVDGVFSTVVRLANGR